MGILSSGILRPTYRACTVKPFVAAAGVLPFFVFTGSASVIAALQRVVLGCPTLTAAAYLEILVSRHSTAFTGGTLSNGTAASALVNVPMGDSTAGVAAIPAATAVCKTYSAGPTGGGTLVGVLDTKRFLASPTAAAAGMQELVFDMRSLIDEMPAYVDGVASCLSLAFANAPASPVTMTLMAEFTEN